MYINLRDKFQGVNDEVNYKYKQKNTLNFISKFKVFIKI